MKRRIVAFLLMIALGISTLCIDYSEVIAKENNTQVQENKTEKEDMNKMSDKQLSSIAMLNYITVLSQEINSSSNSKVYLDNAYSSIVNNVNPNAIDEDTMYEIKQLLDTINVYQSIDTRRERMQYLYEQNQAVAIKKAVPSPLSVLNVVQSGNPLKSVASVVYMAVDSKASYDSYLSDVDSKYMQEGWTLDDEAADNLHESRKEAFSYMVEMCQKNSLDSKLALNEKSVEDFVKWEKNTNISRRIQFLDDNKDTYKAYGKYWLVLAESYYEQGNYKKCLTSINQYKKMNIDTFRKDHDFAKALTLAIDAANEEYSSNKEEKYIELANEYLTIILSNIENEDWTIKYFCAQTYIDLYKKTDDKKYLRSAYSLAKQNVNYLIDEQQHLNELYLENVVKQETQKTDSKAKKNEIKQYNKWLEEERKTELPPVYQPLVLNCDLLFALAGELNASETEREKINDYLHSEGDQVFLVNQLNELYWFNHKNSAEVKDFSFDGEKMEIPAEYLTLGTKIKVVVNENGDESVYEDWTLKEVERNDSKDIKKFVAVYTSKNIKKRKYTKDSQIKVIIIPPVESTYSDLEVKFKTNVGKILRLWDDITFEMVK